MGRFGDEHRASEGNDVESNGHTNMSGRKVARSFVSPQSVYEDIIWQFEARIGFGFLTD